MTGRHAALVRREAFLVVTPDAGCARELSVAIRAAGGVVDVALGLRAARPQLAGKAHPIVLLDVSAADEPTIRGVIAEARAACPGRVFVLLSAGGEVPFDLTDLDDDGGAVVGLLRRPFDARDLRRALADAAALHGQAARASQPGEPARPPLGRVLHVEASDDDADHVAARLSRWNGVRMQRVSSLAAAESALLADEYDLVLTDLNLPDARGFDALHRVRALRPELPIVVLAVLSEAMCQRALSIGAQEVVDKLSADGETLRAALHRARLRGEAQRELRFLATHDPLTGLRNGAAFREQLALVVNRVRRQGGMCAVLYMDLDGFKPINDRLGHDAGDVVLRVVGRRLQGALRGSDFAARIGGDEFAALLQDVGGAQSTTAVAERVLAAVGAPIRLPSGDQVGVTASIGIATCPGTAESPHPLMRAADAAMFGAKQGGRNQYRVARVERRSSVVSDVHRVGEAETGGDGDASVADAAARRRR